MALTSGKNGKAHVLELSNRASIQKLTLTDVAGITASLENHYSGLNTNAHQIGNIAGLQAVLDDKVTKNDDILVNTTGLVNMTSDFKIQVDGYVGHKIGWRDLVAPFTSTSAGAAAPVLVTLPNGIRMYRFGVGDSMHTSYHVDHDYAEGTNAYHHVHWFPETAMPEGTTVTWRIHYVIAKGHNQGESMLAPRAFFDVVYTSPVGGTVIGDHIVSEASDAQSYSLKEPDTIILAEVELLSKTFAGNVFGIQADLHYLSDREVTISKKPNFNISM